MACPSLTLTPPWRQKKILLARITDALRLASQDGFEILPAHQATAQVDLRSRREIAAAREFVVRSRLSSFPLDRLDDESVLALLRKELRTGDLAVVREGEGGDASESDQDAIQRRLVRFIEARGRRLSYAGRQYRLVAGTGLQRLADRNSYEVVGQRDGVAVVNGLAGEAKTRDPELGRLLSEAAAMLTKDWRPPFSPDGLVLLRRSIVQAAIKPDLGPALTPSQIKKLGKNDWIEIEVVDQDGEPYPTHHRLELPSSQVHEGELDEDGFVGVYEIESGTCKLDLGKVMLAQGVAVEEAMPVQQADAADAPEEEVPETDLAEEPASALEYELELPAEEPTPTKLRIKLLDLLGKPMAGATVTIAGIPLLGPSRRRFRAGMSRSISAPWMSRRPATKLGRLAFSTWGSSWTRTWTRPTTK